MPESLQPALLHFTPVYKPYLWGGTDLPRRLGRTDAPPLDRYAESWELADHPDGMSVAEGGPYAGATLHSLVTRFGPDLTGRTQPGFPLLVKILDAADKLSVQVHPDDATARRDGSEAKTACWYILDAAPGAGVWAGLKAGTTEERFKQALAGGNVQDVLQRVPVQPGDLLFIPGGRVHAIGAGCRILEVQQSSNTTYRIFDWNRTGDDGKPRPLHVEQALSAIHWQDPAPALTPAQPGRAQGGGLLIPRLRCPYFQLDELVVRGPFETRHESGSFHALFAVSGGVRVTFDGGEDRLPEGRTGLLPARIRAYTLQPEGPEARLIRISLP